MTLASLPLATIRESSTNPRKTFDPSQLEDLIASVRQFGVLQPVLVRPVAALPGGVTGYELIAGARRFRAAKAAGLAEIPAIVQDLDDRAALEVQVIENLQRADLGVLEEARGFALLQSHGYEVAALAAKVGKSTSYIYGRLQMLHLPADVQELIERGRLTAAHALLLARIQTPEVASEAAQEIAGDEKWGPMSIAEARGTIESRFMLRLDQAPFDVRDPELVPGAGPCAVCPKRTCNQRTLFGDAIEADDLCTDAKCFAAKRTAAFELARQVAEKQGLEILTPSKRAAFDGVRLTDTCYDDPKQRTYAQLLGGRKGVDGVADRVLSQRSDGAAEWRLPRKKLRAALKAAGHDFAPLKPAKPAPSKADQKVQREAKIATQIEDAVMDAVRSKLSLGEDYDEGSVLEALVGCQLGHWLAAADPIAQRWSATKAAPGEDLLRWAPETRSTGQLLAIMFDLATRGWTGQQGLDAFVDAVRIDRAEIEKQVRQRVELDAKASARQTPKPPKPTTKRPKAGKGKLAAAGKEAE